MPETDRERAVEHLLRQTLNERDAPSPGTCVDGETLAAWTTDSLRADQASIVEAHLVDCARCQSLLSTLIRAMPPEPAIEPLWRRWRLPWLVPLATAATVAALWVAAPDRPLAPVASESERPGGRLEPQASASAPLAEPTRTPEPAEARTGAEAPRTPARGYAPEPPAENLQSKADRFDSVGANPASAGNATAAREADAAKELPAAPASVSQLRASGATREILAPGSSTRWRITGSQVERSTSDGANWQEAVVPSTDGLTAGSAVSTSVCWIVGRGGAVYVTNDGLRFMRVSAPESVDLVAVSATDERSAIVTAADGRSWQTTDRGNAWTPVRR